MANSVDSLLFAVEQDSSVQHSPVKSRTSKGRRQSQSPGCSGRLWVSRSVLCMYIVMTPLCSDCVDREVLNVEQLDVIEMAGRLVNVDNTFVY